MNDGLAVEDVMVIWNLTRNHLYVLAHRDKWRRYRDNENRVRYHPLDVAATMDRLAA